MHDRESFLPAAREERLEAYRAGVLHGALLLGNGVNWYSTDPYLQYQYLLGVSQFIANHGRDIAGIGGKHSLDPDKRGAKA